MIKHSTDEQRKRRILYTTQTCTIVRNYGSDEFIDKDKKANLMSLAEDGMNLWRLFSDMPSEIQPGQQVSAFRTSNVNQL